jgi:uncharacterized protein
MIPRYIEAGIKASLAAETNKLVLLLGPRQTGKTTLVRRIMAAYPGKALYLTGDDPSVRARLTDVGIEPLRTTSLCSTRRSASAISASRSS